MVTLPRDKRTLADSEILRAEDVLAHPDDPFPPFIPPIVRAEDVMDHPDDKLPDPPKRVDMQQEMNVRNPASMLEEWLADEKAVVTTEAYLCESTKPPGDTTMGKPDCMVGFGITHAELLEYLNGWIVSELGYPPAFVLEVASVSTGRNDYTDKRDGFMRYYDPVGCEHLLTRVEVSRARQAAEARADAEATRADAAATTRLTRAMRLQLGFVAG